MIKDKCFEKDWLYRFKNKPEYKQIDPALMQKMIYALHLVELLKSNGLNFVFKGGTALILLLDEAHRFSIDVDVISNTDRKTIEEILNKVVQTSRFANWQREDHRHNPAGVPKTHYKLLFDSDLPGSGSILLDILHEDSPYPEHIEMPVKTQWIETEGKITVKLPSTDAITGDKLTAFAPNTIGIPYFKGEQRRSFSMEISKQLYDLSRLFERIEDMETVAISYKTIAEREIAYRRKVRPDTEPTVEKSLEDTINTCRIITGKGGNTVDAKRQFEQLQQGIKRFASFLISGRFRLDIEVLPAAARVAYLAAKIRVNDKGPITYFQGQDIKDLKIEDPGWNFLNKLKRHPDRSIFFYWYQTVQLLTKKTG